MFILGYSKILHIQLYVTDYIVEIEIPTLFAIIMNFQVLMHQTRVLCMKSMINTNKKSINHLKFYLFII